MGTRHKCDLVIKKGKCSIFISSKPKCKTNIAQGELSRGSKQFFVLPLFFGLSPFYFYVSLHEIGITSHLLASQKVFHIERNTCLKNLFQYLLYEKQGIRFPFSVVPIHSFLNDAIALQCGKSTQTKGTTAGIYAFLF